MIHSLYTPGTCLPQKTPSLLLLSHFSGAHLYIVRCMLKRPLLWSGVP
ncbi:Piso0_000340 [Millerozyma farinosa CBS 7064]|uniref:Piso0_000340 protein n=1 Tax=Pichia sorbitophila (strain ATCC MYA-4447 / BCRC 22081 / CBS 7064 / NBRC 10061 / NRRL Y-12695) TaxID=559304 RepID=G8YTQ6_PICSO|nr:Piso0_000340 [Millerozyma farinosa CBS 7064]CCE73307.1 Piso0_000340 [Millerozyma farinosa CBS 7064]